MKIICPPFTRTGHYKMEDMDNDRELLIAYARDGSDEAFAALTRRYLDLVYSAALRQLRDPDQARDVAQAVFLLLARKARSLSPETILAGWLYRTARFISMEAQRADKRRRIREESMATAFHNEPSTDEMWQQVSPHLDEAMEHIPPADRNAIILRYFQDRPLRELASTLGLSEEAAKKRVSRALEKLRGVLARKGIKSSTSLLAATLVASAVQPAPSALAAVILPALGAKATAALPVKILVKGAIQMMTYTKIQASAVAAVVLLMVAGTGYVGVDHFHAWYQHTHPAPEQAIQGLAPGLSQPQQELLAQTQGENQRLRAEARELYRLRDTVTQLRFQLRSASAPPNTVRLQDAPRELQDSAERLRELQFQHYLSAGQKALALQPLDEEETHAYTLEVNFMKNLGLALRIYSTDHGNEFPLTIETLLGNDDGQVLDDQMKKRLQTGKYEYIHFSQAESKPALPAVWFRDPDEKGIRVVVLNDGSVQKIREPVGVPKPGYLSLATTK